MAEAARVPGRASRRRVPASRRGSLQRWFLVQPEEDADALELARRGLSEFAGTFALTFVAAGALVVAAISRGEVDHVSRTVAPGLLVMAFVYALGDVSGAHFNPAVTLAFAVRRAFPLVWVPLYWAAQLLGAVAAAVVLRLVLGDVAHLGATEPRLGVGPAFAFEVVLSWLLVIVIVGTADRYRLVGPNAALAVGATIALCGLFASPVSDASMNPARSLGPAIVSGNLANAWIYLVAPALGALAAVATAAVLHGNGAEDPKTREAAGGEPKRH